MPFGRPAPEIPEELVQKRLKGLLERATLKEKASPNKPYESKFPKAEYSQHAVTDDSSDADEDRNVKIIPRSNVCENKPMNQKSKANPKRNSLLRRETQNLWKRKVAENEVEASQLKKRKKEASSGSSSEGEKPAQKNRVKREKMGSLTDSQQPLDLCSPPSSPSTSEDETIRESLTKPSEDAGTPERAPVNVEFLAEEPDEVFFKPLGVDTRVKKKSEIAPVLPRWVKQAVPVSAKVESCGDLDEDVDILGKSLVKALRDDGIVGLFPMQKQVIRELLDPRYLLLGLPPRDICVAAPTGSGKTLAFVLPLIKLLEGLFEKAIRAVILLPTSELAKQVYDVFTHYAKPFQISAALLTGLKSHSEEVRTLLEGGHLIVDVVIATPKSFLKHLRLTPGFDLKLVSHLVLDEADRMVDMISHGLIREIEEAIYSQTALSCSCSGNINLGRSRPAAISCCAMDAHSLPLRKLLYSATLMSDPEKLRHANLFYPRVFHAKAEHTSERNKAFALPDSLEEIKIFCEISIRPLLVWWLSAHKKMDRMIVFTRTREECHRLRVVIECMGDCKVVDLSANLKKRQRQKVLADFDEGHYNVLVCTNVLSRGMDLKNVEHVVLYHVPNTAEDYVHMVGRTARANKHGKSIVLLNRAESSKLSKTLKTISNSKLKELHCDLDRLTEFEDCYKQALASAKETIFSKPT